MGSFYEWLFKSHLYTQKFPGGKILEIPQAVERLRSEGKGRREDLGGGKDRSRKRGGI